MNSVNLTGRLGRDPELRQTQNGVSSLFISIAVSRDQKPREGDPDADWIRIQLYRQSAEYICDYGAKGDKIAVTGKIRTYKDHDGRDQVYVLADSVELLGVKKESSSGTGKMRKSPSTTKRQQLPTATPEQIAQWEFEETGKEIDPNELPF